MLPHRPPFSIGIQATPSTTSEGALCSVDWEMVRFSVRGDRRESQRALSILVATIFGLENSAFIHGSRRYCLSCAAWVDRGPVRLHFWH